MVIMSCPKAARVCRLDDASAGDPITIPPKSSVICIRILQAGAKLEDDHQMAHSSVNRAYMMNLIAAPPPHIIMIIIISFPDPQCACKDFPCPNCQRGRSFNSSFLPCSTMPSSSSSISQLIYNKFEDLSPLNFSFYTIFSHRNVWCFNASIMRPLRVKLSTLAQGFLHLPAISWVFSWEL